MSLTDNGAATEVTALPVPNLPLLRKVLDHIDAHPDEWNQLMFESSPQHTCGTTRCIAGWVNYWTFGDAFGNPDSQHGPAGDAAELLGLTQDEQGDLFFGSIDDNAAAERHNVQRVAEAIAARAGERL